MQDSRTKAQKNKGINWRHEAESRKKREQKNRRRIAKHRLFDEALAHLT